MKRKILFTLIGFVLLASCATTKLFDFSQVQIGMSKEDVSATLKRSPYKVLGAKQYPNGTMEVQEYYYVMMSGKNVIIGCTSGTINWSNMKLQIYVVRSNQILGKTKWIVHTIVSVLSEDRYLVNWHLFCFLA